MEALENHPDWASEAEALRRLASGLLGDPHAGDDAVQEAWLRAHTRAAGHPDEPRAFWRRVVANLSRDRRRGESRRVARETAAAQPEALPSTDEVASRLELAELAARTAAELDEPYRTTVHLRYFEELSLAEIAERSGVPLETARTRLRRGLERMRARLDRSARGGREAWCLALAPLAMRSAREASPAAGAALVAVGGGLLAVKKLALFAAAVVAALSIAWLVSREPLNAPHSAAPVQVADAPASIDVDRPDTPGAPLPSAREAQLEPAGPATVATPGGAPNEVRGTLRLVDPVGGDRDDPDGWIVVERLAANGVGQEDLVEVAGGRWSAAAQPGERLVFAAALVDDLMTDLDADPVDVPHEGEVALEAVAWPRTTLRVVDAATGVDLRGVELRYSTMNYMARATLHPGDVGPFDVQQLDLGSPFTLPLPGGTPEDESLRLWVRAPGYAWGYCDALARVGGERTVELSAGGDLEVFPVGPRPSIHWVVYLVGVDEESRAAADRVAWQSPSEGAATRFEGLAPGTYRVGAMPRVVGSAGPGSSETFEVRAGETTRVDLALDELPLERTRSRLVGSLRVSEESPTGALRFVPVGGLQGRDHVFVEHGSMAQDPEDPRLLHWDAGEVEVGEYHALHPAAGLVQRFEVGAAPQTRLELELPERAWLEVRTRDARTGASLPGTLVRWSVFDAGVRDPVSQQHRDLLEEGLLRLNVPALELQVEVAATDCSSHSELLHLEPGETRELVVPLERLTGLRVRFVEGTTQVPRTYARPKLLDAYGEPVRGFDWRWSESTCRIQLLPGVYRMSFEGLEEDGWTTPEPVDVRVVPGELSPVDVPLVRAD